MHVRGFGLEMTPFLQHGPKALSAPPLLSVCGVPVIGWRGTLDCAFWTVLHRFLSRLFEDNELQDPLCSAEKTLRLVTQL
ncbi:unnamed protein product [Boreogadus saida]